MAASYLPRSTDNLELATRRSRILFLDSEPAEITPATAVRLALDSTKKNCYTAVLDGDYLLVLEYFAVGD